MRRLLILGTGFDWTTFPRMLFSAFLHSDGHNPLTGAYAFFIPANSPWAGRRVHGLLMRKGVRSWGSAYAFGRYSFQVPRSKAQLAQGLMQKAGVPLLGAASVPHPDTGSNKDRP